MSKNPTIKPFKATPSFKWKYLWFALGLNLIVIAATGDMLTWWNTPRWVIMILRFLSFTLILPYFAAYWAVMQSRKED